MQWMLFQFQKRAHEDRGDERLFRRNPHGYSRAVFSKPAGQEDKHSAVSWLRDFSPQIAGCRFADAGEGDLNRSVVYDYGCVGFLTAG